MHAPPPPGLGCRAAAPARGAALLACRAASPRAAGGVAAWAARRFDEAVAAAAGRPDRLPLAKLCMLVALEEDAAAAAAGGGGPPDAAVGSSTSSTWSLRRLDALAAEAAALFYARAGEAGVAGGVGAAAAAGAPDGALLALHSDLVAGFATLLLTSINDVLYARHGYRRQRAHGDTAADNLRAVLDAGSGSPAALALLYQEVAARCGLALACYSAPGEPFFFLAPAAGSGVAPLSAAGGRRFFVDPYARGALVSEDELAELFGRGGGGGDDGDGDGGGRLAPAPPAALLAALLEGLQASHWAAAVRCPPQPALAVPVDEAVAMGTFDEVEVEGGAAGGGRRRRWWPTDRAALRRAAAAARKRALLLPGCAGAARAHGVLLYLCGRHAEAAGELERGAAAVEAAGGDAAATRALLARARLEAALQAPPT